MEYTAESIVELHKHRDRIRGLKMVYEPKELRFFQAMFEQVQHVAVSAKTLSKE